ncbi:MAG: hypothetical protein HY301_07690 [Verrucomicrobia bacterium]|nr:hypothetical protein [Verrucomicrobiota bacterium]
MKPKNKKPKVPAAVHFELAATAAREVCVAGSFNDWHPAASPMIDLGGGRWAKDLALPPGAHEYLFVVDGQWWPDPGARATVPNPFGGVNSVVTVASRAAM